MTAIIRTISMALALFIPLASIAEETREQRFMAAKKAAYNGQWAEFLEIKEELSNHTLHPYLEYYYLRSHFNTVDKNQIQQYLDKHPQSPLAAKLRRKWLYQLAEVQDWRQYLKIYQTSKYQKLQCYYFIALQQTGQGQQAHEEITALWLTGKSLQDNCDVVFNTWLAQSNDKTNLVWQRFELALKRYNFKLAKALIKRLPPQQQQEARAIIALYAKPHLVTQKSYLKQQPSAEVISYGIFRLARRNPDAAIRTWERLSKHYQFNQKQKQRVFQAIALRFAMRKSSRATTWFRKVVGYKLDPVYKEWMIRAALFHGDWLLVKDSIAALPQEETDSSKWQYWYARALGKLGDKKAAQTIFIQLATVRDYHGFLARKQLQKTLHVKHEVPPLTEKEINTVKQSPGFQRAKLLYQLNQKHDARLELYYLMKYSDAKQQYIIMKLVSDWGWHTAVLRLARHAEHKDDVVLRFPLIYQEMIFNHAKKRNLNPALVYAIIRQESLFMPHAISSAGAIGLMQLMPHTAYKTSKQFQLKYTGQKQLLNGQTNITFGSAHLKKLHEQFAGHPVLMIAAYNAGRRAVNRWLPKNKTMPADIWVETVPFYETRDYLKKVIANYVVYQYRLGQEPSLKNIMKPVGP